MEATVETLMAGLNNEQFTSVDLVKVRMTILWENRQWPRQGPYSPGNIKPTCNQALRLEHLFHLPVGLYGFLSHPINEFYRRTFAGSQKPLHGIPIIIKDNIATFDKMNTTGQFVRSLDCGERVSTDTPEAGSWALLGAMVPRDSTVVEKLRAVGAIILGKANLSQWADWRSRNSSNGWSAIGGQVYGPYWPAEDPNGSSSGSAVAAALGLALGCLGTETDGSIMSPASLENLVGIKPNSVGPMTKTVKDAAHILQAIAGVDPYDNYTSAIPGNGSIPDYIAACNISALSGARIGVPRNVLSLYSDNTTGPLTDAFERALLILQEAGAIIVDNSNFTAAEEFKNSTLPTEILNADFVVNLEGYLDLLIENPSNITSLESLRNFTQSFPLEDYPTRDTGVWDQALANWNNTDPRFWPAYQKNMYYGGEGGLLGAIERNVLDAVVLPTKFGHSFAAVVGTPAITVPLGSYPADTPIVKNDWGLVELAPNLP
ncbi:uncharacterized protein N0V89_008923 [Didymosphaeria variabile]|uniref:Amidase domain-containing protein n=1 Tax=Didymosphaeria variabile TaxID=1932322 RepID=A0A9W9C9R2_9PLEO|nr:uncharacterized protein N0V89_008923 [Didymosphaeria variabile]KAJ4350302.1 hypothetical protein N0V89_008923 [Didymosphaeria variabile]